MTSVISSISVSLDGYVAGPDPMFEDPLGVGGERLHEWVFKLRAWREPHAGYEGGEPLTLADTTFHFVTGGVEDAVAQAKAAAGERAVHVSGGAEAIQGCIAAGLLDELELHLVPVLLGSGTRLLDGMDPGQRLELDRVVAEPDVTHLRYAIGR